MEKLSLLSVLLATMLIVSCSSDEPSIPSTEKLESEATIDMAFSRSLTDGFTSATYELSEAYLFDQSILTNGNWVYVDLSDLAGHSIKAPSTIVIQDGKAHTTYSMFSSATGPTLIGSVWNALQYSKSEKKTLCLARKFELVESGGKFNVIIGNETFELQGLTKDSFQLAHISKYLGGESKQGGMHKEITIHRAVSHEDVSTNVVEYETETELIRDVVAQAKARFGNTLDLNELYKGFVIYDNPERYIINLDDVLKYYGIEE